MRISIDTRPVSAALEIAHHSYDADFTIGFGVLLRFGRKWVYGRRWGITTAYARHQRRDLSAIGRLDLRPPRCAESWCNGKRYPGVIFCERHSYVAALEAEELALRYEVEGVT